MNLRSLPVFTFVAFAAMAAPPDGESLYKQRCAVCHAGPKQDRMPSFEDMRTRTPENLLEVMSKGAMKPQSAGLSEEELRSIARFVAGKDFGAVSAPAQQGLCQGPAPKFQIGATDWNGWGGEATGSRYQPKPGIRAEDVPRLQVKWAFAVPGANVMAAQPVVVGGRVFFGAMNGKVYSLDAETGCQYWSFDAGAPVRAAVSIAKVDNSFVALFGDSRATAHAVDALTGKPLWSQKLDDHPVARVTGSPVYANGRLYVPMSSVEEASAMNAKYECCKFRGSVSALDARTGKVLFKAYSIPDPPSPYKKSDQGVQQYGPAGAAIWSGPTIDQKRKLIYAATGNSYTGVETKYSDAVIAYDLETGSMKWASQVTPGDNFVMGCGRPGNPNCPESLGPDHDFGTSPILRKLKNGKEIIVAAQKSGVVFGLDPDDNGKILWQTRVSKGGALGGVEWGHAVDDEQVYAAASDLFQKDGEPGITALNLATGAKVWSTPAPPLDCKPGARGCNAAQSAAVTVIPGVVFSGSVDGHLRGYDTRTGKIIWDFNTAREYQTVNGVPGKGASIDYGGPAVVGGKLFSNSGSGQWAGAPGNVLLCFTVDGK
jgi:polyvinyl alcohol dehydrogenase (cytochrome)